MEAALIIVGYFLGMFGMLVVYHSVKSNPQNEFTKFLCGSHGRELLFLMWPFFVGVSMIVYAYCLMNKLAQLVASHISPNAKTS